MATTAITTVQVAMAITEVVMVGIQSLLTVRYKHIIMNR